MIQLPSSLQSMITTGLKVAHGLALVVAGILYLVHGPVDVVAALLTFAGVGSAGAAAVSPDRPGHVHAPGSVTTVQTIRSPGTSGGGSQGVGSL